MSEVVHRKTGRVEDLYGKELEAALASGEYALHGDTVTVTTPEGATIEIPKESYQPNLTTLAGPATLAAAQQEADRAEKYGSQNALTLLERGINSLSFGGSGALAKFLGDEEYLRDRELRAQYNPNIALIGDIGGAALPVFLSGGQGLIGTIARATPAGASAQLSARGGAALFRGTSAASRAGALAVEGALDGAAYNAATSLSQAYVDDSPITVESLAASIGSGAAFGGLAGGTLGAAGAGLKRLNKGRGKKLAIQELDAYGPEFAKRVDNIMEQVDRIKVPEPTPPYAGPKVDAREFFETPPAAVTDTFKDYPSWTVAKRAQKARYKADIAAEQVPTTPGTVPPTKQSTVADSPSVDTFRGYPEGPPPVGGIPEDTVSAFSQADTTVGDFPSATMAKRARKAQYKADLEAEPIRRAEATTQIERTLLEPPPTVPDEFLAQSTVRAGDLAPDTVIQTASSRPTNVFGPEDTTILAGRLAPDTLVNAARIDPAAARMAREADELFTLPGGAVDNTTTRIDEATAQGLGGGSRRPGDADTIPEATRDFSTPRRRWYEDPGRAERARKIAEETPPFVPPTLGPTPQPRAAAANVPDPQKVAFAVEAIRRANRALRDKNILGNGLVFDVSRLAQKTPKQAFRIIEAIDNFAIAVKRFDNYAGTNLAGGLDDIMSVVGENGLARFQKLAGVEDAALAKLIDEDLGKIPQNRSPVADQVLRAYAANRALMATERGGVLRNLINAAAFIGGAAHLGLGKALALQAAKRVILRPLAEAANAIGIVQSTRARVSDAVDKFAKKATSRGAGVKASRMVVPAVSAFQYSERRKKKHETPDMAKLLSLKEAVENPLETQEKIHDRLQVLRALNPVTGYAVAAQLQNRLQFLYGKIPPSLLSDPKLGRMLKQPSASEMDRFLRYAKAADDPLSILDDLAANRLTDEGVETVKFLYPELFREIQQELLIKVSEIREDVNYNTRLQLSVILEMPLEESLEPPVVGTIQSIYQQQAAQQAGPQRISGTPSIPPTETKGQRLTER